MSAEVRCRPLEGDAVFGGDGMWELKVCCLIAAKLS